MVAGPKKLQPVHRVNVSIPVGVTEEAEELVSRSLAKGEVAAWCAAAISVEAGRPPVDLLGEYRELVVAVGQRTADHVGAGESKTGHGPALLLAHFDVHADGRCVSQTAYQERPGVDRHRPVERLPATT